MTEQTKAENTELAEDQEAPKPEDVKEEIQEEAEQEIEDQQPEEDKSPEELNHDALLRAAKLQALVDAYVPAGVDVESELDYVGGLSIKDGKVVGEAKYRKAPTETQTESKASTKKAAPRNADATAVDDWPKERTRIQEYKRKMGI